MNQKTATIISRLFDPFIVLTAVLALALPKSSLSGYAQMRFFIVSLLTLLGIPFILLILAIKKGLVKNWDLSDRRERPKVLGTLLIIELLNLFAIRIVADQFLFSTILFILWLHVGFFLVSLFWKISYHAAINAVVTGLIVRWYGWGMWLVLLIVPLVGWSRIVRKDHTLAQVVVGALYAWGLIVLFMR